MCRAAARGGRGDIDNGYCVAAAAEAEAGLVLYHSVSAVLSQESGWTRSGSRCQEPQLSVDIR